jgi:hypothetical protein
MAYYPSDRHPGTGGWSNRFVTRTSDQIQKGVNAFGQEYTAGQLGPRGAQPGFGKAMPEKNPHLNELFFNVLRAIGEGRQREQAKKDEMVSRGSLINMRKDLGYMPNFLTTLYG